MSIMNSLYTGVSGLTAHGIAMDIIGDNIANVNTVGFKSARGVFGDILSQFLPGAGTMAQMGRGVRATGIEQNFTQGSYISTSNVTDLAVAGNGFFVAKGTHDGINGMFYTRAGQMRLDSEGYLTSPDGLRIQGYAADIAGQTTMRTLTDLRLAGTTLPPQATTSVTLTAALNPTDTIVPAGTFDPTNPDSTSSFSTTVTVYDSIGQSHQVNVYMNRTADGQWEWHALANGDEVVPAAPGTMVEIADGTVSFDNQGRLDQEQTNNNTVTFAGAQAQQIAFDFGDSITTDGGTGLEGTTQFSAQASAVLVQEQNGRATGVLQTLSVDQDGVITGGFSNGEIRTLGQVALATFQSDRGLRKVGGNMWVATPESGPASIGAANTGARGAILSNSLEQSNVDLATEFVNMITTQRGYQASSRTITTADQLLNDVIGLKR